MYCIFFYCLGIYVLYACTKVIGNFHAWVETYVRRLGSSVGYILNL